MDRAAGGFDKLGALDDLDCKMVLLTRILGLDLWRLTPSLPDGKFCTFSI